MKLIAFTAILSLALVGACGSEDKDDPEVAARKVECRKLTRHLFELSPESGVQALSGAEREKKLDELVAKVPIEDIEQCGAAYPEVVSCMAAATDLAGVQTCIPKEIACEGPATEVKGDRPTYELAGECKAVKISADRIAVFGKAADTVEITASNVTVRIDSAKTITIAGSNNKIIWKVVEGTAAPKIDDHGANNTIVKVEPKKSK